jgi:chemotaxis protein CheD
VGGAGHLSEEAVVIDTDGSTALMTSRLATPRFVVGIGEAAIEAGPGGVIVTHALGSCIAVCIFDPVSRVGGLLHFLLPESRINPTRAQAQPLAFADTGIPLFFQAAYAKGLNKKSCVVKLVGGAEVTGDGTRASMGVGKRNALAARNLLWRNSVLVKGEALGGATARTVTLHLEDGRLEITNGRDLIGTL